MRVGVLYGGWSSERDISLVSGRNVADALKRRGYDVVLIDVQRDFPERVKEYNIDVAFIMLHGTPGEDGIIQGVLEFMQIPYTGSGVLASALAMDKVLSKKVFISSGIPTPDFIYPATEKLPSNWDFPVVVKPRAEGSSVGVSIVDSPDGLPYAIALASKYGEVFIEEYIDGMIATCGILGDEALPVLELVPVRRRFYDYKAKYTEGETEFIVPARLSHEVTQKTQKIALKAHQVLGCRHFSRVDMVIKDGKEPYVLEVNTVPGMTPLSDLPKEAEAAGISYDELVERILLMGIK